MNSDLMPSSESSNSPISEQTPTNTEAANPKISATAEVKESENLSADLSETTSDENNPSRLCPIPPPSEPMQYRAIGLVRGRYKASSEQFTQGSLVTPDGVELNTVLLGRIMSLVKNHLDLEQEHLWVVYPRTRQENEQLHIQIVGVWEPENLAKNATVDEEQEESTSAEAQTSDIQSNDIQSSDESSSDESITTSEEKTTPTPVNSTPLVDGSFSIRGEIVYQSYDSDSLVIKIRQQPRKTGDKLKYFKIKLIGKLEGKAVGKFWDMQVKREGDTLVVEQAEFIAELPKKRRPPFNKGGGARRPFKGGGGSNKPFRKPSGEIPRPFKRTGENPPPPSKPTPAANLNRVTPKPIKKAKPMEGE
ncbi:MAG: hypothetical protein KME64_04335 [Scytonematopsis contorta HA4267-MV1]|jgi:hypothetical protein|nr:hypothetical protein [Scytonematopsis contorta HA4267-MV1]